MPETTPDVTDSPGPGLSVDALRPDKQGWAPIVEGLSNWKQGDIVTGVPVGWMGAPDADVITGVDGNGSEDAVVMTDTVDVIVCSQTCDIGGKPPGDKHPFVMVAPLIASADVSGEDRGLAKADQHGSIAIVPRPDLGDDASEQYADLRMLVPLSKALLLTRDPVPGLDGLKAIALSEMLAQKFRRPALSDVLSEELPAYLEKFIKNTGRGQQCFVKSEQVRLVVHEGTRLEPETVQLLILTKVELTEEEHLMWARASEGLTRVFGKGAIKSLPPMVSTVDSLSVRLYRSSVPVRTALLGPTLWL